MNRWRWTGPRGEHLGYFETPDGEGPPDVGHMRPRHSQPAVVLEQSRHGSISGASWCVACPDGGAADPVCCAHKQFLALNAQERERVTINVPEEIPEGRRRLSALAYTLRLRKRSHEH